MVDFEVERIIWFVRGEDREKDKFVLLEEWNVIKNREV